jgi:hypothetical protein
MKLVFGVECKPKLCIPLRDLFAYLFHVAQWTNHQPLENPVDKEQRDRQRADRNRRENSKAPHIQDGGLVVRHLDFHHAKRINRWSRGGWVYRRQARVAFTETLLFKRDRMVVVKRVASPVFFIRIGFR